MNFIKIENNYSWLLSSDKELKEKVWNLLRFKSRNYWHNVQYRMKIWDGYTEFFKKESGRFLTGLFPEVKAILKHLCIDYKIEDSRGKVNFICDSVDENWLDRVKLRDYQIDYINQIIKNKRGIIPSPTSSGKSLTMVGILKAVEPGTPCLVLGNKKQLVEQNYDEICKFGIKNVGKFHGDKKDPDIITCATFQSLHHLKSWLPKVKVLIVDEIHEMISKGTKSVYSKLTNASVRVGMSATAFKFGGSDKVQKFEVKGWIGPMLATDSTESGYLTTKELQDRDILSTSECFFFVIKEPQLLYEIYTDAVTKGIAENEYLHEMVVDLTGRLKGRVLIIVERIEHGDRLFDKMPNAFWIKGEDNIETRKHVIEKLKTADNAIGIATSGIFNTGINVFVNYLINAAGGQAEHQIIQRFGRGLRRASDKDHLQYFDFLFENNDYLKKHSTKRMRILKKEGHSVKILESVDKFFNK